MWVCGAKNSEFRSEKSEGRGVQPRDDQQQDGHPAQQEGDGDAPQDAGPEIAGGLRPRGQVAGVDVGPALATANDGDFAGGGGAKDGGAQQQEQAKDVLADVEKLLGSETFDAYEQSPTVLKGLVAAVKELRTREQALQQRLEQTAQADTARSTAETYWTTFAQEHPGIDGKAIYHQHLQALAETGVSGEALHRAATYAFRQDVAREKATKTAAAKAAPNKGAEQKPAPGTPAPPPGAKVTGSNGGKGPATPNRNPFADLSTADLASIAANT